MLHEEKLNWERKTNEILMKLKEKDSQITHLENKIGVIAQGEKTVAQDFNYMKDENHKLILEIADLKNCLEFVHS